MMLHKLVTQASAGFYGHTADKILNADHHDVCKFENKFGGYIQVLHHLNNIRMTLLRRTLGEINTAGKTKV